MVDGRVQGGEEEKWPFKKIQTGNKFLDSLEELK